MQLKMKIIQIVSIFMLPLLPIPGSGAALGTRQRTITPVAITNLPVPLIFASDVPDYSVDGYSNWRWGPGDNPGQQLTNMPAGYPGATNAARLLSFFCISDIHITDKESPSQSLITGYQSQYGDFGNSSSYSPVILSTTQVLDAAVKTANALHRLIPFDFAMSLGDDCNSSQYNELRWFIDVMDGQPITPSSGTNAGADTIDYQKPYQAAGLDPSIPWYAVLGNHDHFWCGAAVVDPYLRASYTNNVVLLMGDLKTNGVNSRIEYLGTIDGSTPYGSVIGVGLVTNFVVGGVTNAPTVAADPNRYSLTVTNWMREFFTTTSKPVGHGFSQANVTNDFACYSFEPKANMPIKVIVIDDTMTDETFDFNGQGGLSTNHFSWLTNELQMGQDADQLMIIAAHIPIELIAVPESTNASVSAPDLLTALHEYPNLLLWVAGHMHRNNIKPQTNPGTKGPEYSFWEVENPSLRDYPQEFRTFEILRNTDNSISIIVTDIDPDVTPESPADKSRGYAVGASRIFGAPNTNATDTCSYTCNGELVKLLTPHMQAVIAGYGEPLGHKLAIDHTETGVVINFLGELQSADTLLGPWSDVANISPYAVSATNAARFYRAAE